MAARSKISTVFRNRTFSTVLRLLCSVTEAKSPE